MSNLSRQYCAYFGQATEVWKRHVIGEIIVAFDEYRDSVCQTLQDAANSGANASTGGGQDINNQEMFGVVLENAQQQAEQRIMNAVNLTLNQPPTPSVSLSPVVSILANQTVHVSPPGESVISQGGVSSGQNNDDDNSLDVSIKSEATDDEEVQVKEEPNEEEEDEDITVRSEEQTENNNNSGRNEDDDNSLDVSIKSEVDSSSESECESDTEDEEMQVKEEQEGQVNMSGVEENDEEENDDEDEDSLMNHEDSSNDTTDDAGEEEQAAGPSTSTGRRSTRQVSKRQIVPDRQSKREIKMKKKPEPLRVITLKLKCTVSGCKKVVKSKSALNSHLLSTHKLKKYRCLVRRCHGKVSTSFATKSQLTDHRDQVHSNTNRWTCHCSKKFKSYQELNTHYWHYHQLGRFACSKDGCTFKPTSTRVKVLIHQYHHFEAKYDCPVDGCGKSFKKKDILDKHTLTHTGERPFPCPECDKSFTQKGALTVHLRIHRNDKCFRCTWPQCTYSSTTRGNVITHIRMVHFKLPATKKQQAEENITDDRDARDYLVKD